MTIHLIKLCVGIDDVEHLIRVHKSRLAAPQKHGQPEAIRHITRNMPRRSEELLNGGSLYWVIRRIICVRQPILSLERLEHEDGRSVCAIYLGTKYVQTVPRQSRAFQGWRYLSAKEAPMDIENKKSGMCEELPLEMTEELREMGLL